MEQALKLHLSGHLHEAAKAYQVALQKAPDNADLLINYGGLLCSLGAYDEARRLLVQAVTVDPACVTGWCNLGNCLQRLQQYGDAIAAYRNGLQIMPTHALALSNLGLALDCSGEHALAKNFHQTAISLDPDNVQSRMNHARSLLSAGDYQNGFREYEWRWVPPGTRNDLQAREQWKGEVAPDATLLIHADGHFGDMLQFVRFVPEAEKRCGRVIVRVQKELLSLLQRSFPATHFISEDDLIPEYDVQCPVMSLPFALGTTLDTLPFANGYLRADPDKVAVWRDRIDKDIALGPVSNRIPLRVGLVWTGSPHRDVPGASLIDQRRSTDLASFAPLVAAVPDAMFYSLQIGERAEQAKTPPHGMRIIDHTAMLRDFDDTAAFVNVLDLVIAVDTSTAHVAAGLGKPTWMLSRFDQCWRWLSRRIDTPWYDTLRIYQQAKPLDWADPIERVCVDLQKFNASFDRK